MLVYTTSMHCLHQETFISHKGVHLIDMYVLKYVLCRWPVSSVQQKSVIVGNNAQLIEQFYLYLKSLSCRFHSSLTFHFECQSDCFDRCQVFLKYASWYSNITDSNLPQAQNCFGHVLLMMVWAKDVIKQYWTEPSILYLKDLRHFFKRNERSAVVFLLLLLTRWHEWNWTTWTRHENLKKGLHKLTR